MSAERGRMRIVGVLAVALGACADGEAAAGRWTGVVDTLSTGTVEVRNPQTGRWTGDSGWALVEDLRIGALQGADPARIFGRIGDIEVDAAGRIWVLDTDAAELRVFEGDGRHRVTFGKRGEGPGEFSRPAALVRGPDDRIWVVDTGNHRYMIFDAGKGLVEEKRRFAS
ncbi:MAG TPA: 6-bladed beta-propeller, partial [Longimicrobiales bacterium]|nr:6-bladed beta-propeller [Longimicrobiales bacterium]